MAATTSSRLPHLAMTAGRRSTIAFQTRRASRYPASSGPRTRPPNRRRSAQGTWIDDRHVAVIASPRHQSTGAVPAATARRSRMGTWADELGRGDREPLRRVVGPHDGRCRLLRRAGRRGRRAAGRAGDRNGRVAIPVAQATGRPVVGVDSSPAMLAQARARADAAGVELDLREGDMRDLALDEPAALIYCPFRALLHVPTWASAAAPSSGSPPASGRAGGSPGTPSPSTTGSRPAWTASTRTSRYPQDPLRGRGQPGRHRPRQRREDSLWRATRNEWLRLVDRAGLELEALYGGSAREPSRHSRDTCSSPAGDSGATPARAAARSSAGSPGQAAARCIRCGGVAVSRPSGPAGESPAALVDRAMMRAAQQGQVVQVGGGRHRADRADR